MKLIRQDGAIYPALLFFWKHLPNVGRYAIMKKEKLIINFYHIEDRGIF